MTIDFFKYQGAGNDFIIIDNRFKEFDGDKEKTAVKLCNRKFGIGSDGLIFIEPSIHSTFKMDFLNPDGSRSFCGNGSRCAVKYIFDTGDVDDQISFEAIDGEHIAKITNLGVLVEMNDVKNIDIEGRSYFTDTGSPHYVSFFDTVNELDMIKFGHKIRYSDKYNAKGTNVNAVEVVNESHIKVRTYERGVENETLACGTGVTACALSYGLLNNLSEGEINIDALGGNLIVSFKKSKFNVFTDIWLEGPAIYVFKGEINV